MIDRMFSSLSSSVVKTIDDEKTKRLDVRNDLRSSLNLHKSIFNVMGELDFNDEEDILVFNTMLKKLKNNIRDMEEKLSDIL